MKTRLSSCFEATMMFSCSMISVEIETNKFVWPYRFRIDVDEKRTRERVRRAEDSQQCYSGCVSERSFRAAKPYWTRATYRKRSHAGCLFTKDIWRDGNGVCGACRRRHRRRHGSRYSNRRHRRMRNIKLESITANAKYSHVCERKANVCVWRVRVCVCHSYENAVGPESCLRCTAVAVLREYGRHRFSFFRSSGAQNAHTHNNLLEGCTEYPKKGYVKIITIKRNIK